MSASISKAETRHKMLLFRPSVLMLGVSYAGFVMVGMTGPVRGVAWPSIQEEFALSLDAAGAWFLTGTLGYFISSITLGRVAARLGLGPALALGSLITALGLLGTALAPTWAALVAAGLVGGLGGGLFNSGTNTFIATNYGPRYMNWLHACFGIGATLGPLVMANLFQMNLSWRWAYTLAFLIQSLLTLCYVLTPGWWRVGGMGAPETAGLGPTKPAAARDTLALPALWFSLGLFFLTAGVESTTGQWAYTFYTETRAIVETTAALWVSFYWGAYTVGRIIFGVIGERVALSALVRMGMIGALGGLLVFGSAAGSASALGLAVMGFMVAPVAPLLTVNALRQLGSMHAANAIGFQIASASLAIALMPALASVLAERAGIEVLWPFLLVLVALMLVLHEVSRRAARRQGNSV